MEQALAPARPAGFLQTRLGSFLAVAPLGVWTVAHVWHNLAALQGERAWETAVTGYEHQSAMAITAFVVLAPLAIHTAWGIKRMLTSRPNNQRYGYFENAKYLLQRISAIGVLAFLGAHLWLAFIHPRVVEGHAEPFSDIAHEMRHHGPTLAVYVLGTLGVAYHLANGLHGFAMGWGLTTSRAALKRSQRLALGFFVVLLTMSWAAIYGLYEAGA